MASINRVILVGNLTRDPELKTLPSGMSVCSLGIAVNHRRKNQQTGEWTEEPNYFSKVGRVDGLPAQRGSVPPDGKRTWDGVVVDPLSSLARYQSCHCGEKADRGAAISDEQGLTG